MKKNMRRIINRIDLENEKRLILKIMPNELSLGLIDCMPNRVQRFELENGNKFYFEVDEINYVIMVDLDIIEFKKNDYFGGLYMRKWNETDLRCNGIKVNKDCCINVLNETKSDIRAQIRVCSSLEQDKICCFNIFQAREMKNEILCVPKVNEHLILNLRSMNTLFVDDDYAPDDHELYASTNLIRALPGMGYYVLRSRPRRNI